MRRNIRLHLSLLHIIGADPEEPIGVSSWMHERPVEAIEGKRILLQREPGSVVVRVDHTQSSRVGDRHCQSSAIAIKWPHHSDNLGIAGQGPGCGRNCVNRRINARTPMGLVLAYDT